MNCSMGIKVCLISLIMISTTQVNATRWTPWIGASEVYPNGAPIPGDGVVTPGGIDPKLGPFMWYCAGDLAECPDEKTNFVHFQYRFDTKDFLREGEQALDIHEMEVTIQADDFFAMYINGRLALHSWLDDLDPIPEGQGAKKPLEDRLGGFLNLGSNVIDIIACDGYPPAHRIIPGPSLDQASIACPHPSDRVNNYVTFFADVTLNLQQGDEIYIGHNLILSGTEWDVRADLPEPTSISLITIGFLGIFLRRRTKLMI